MAEAKRAGTFGPELVQRIAHGEKDALAELYDQSSRLVYSLVLQLVQEPVAAERITLGVYKQVWRTASKYAPERSSVNGWLVAIARTQSLDWIRLRQSRVSRDLDKSPYLEVK